MKKNRYRAERFIYITVWSVILILAINVLVKGIFILGGDSVAKKASSLKERIISSAINHMYETEIPIVKYVSNKEQYDSNGFLVDSVVGGFPINQYIASANEKIKEDNHDNSDYIEENDTLIFAYGEDILFNNEKYMELIMKGIQDANEKMKGNEENILTAEASTSDTLPMDIIDGEVYMEVEDATIPHDTQAVASVGDGEHFTLEQLLDKDFLFSKFYIVDQATVVDKKLFDAKKFLKKDMTLKTTKDKPQILVYHTHSQEGFMDSREGVEEDTVIGLGNVLVDILENEYGYNVIHDKSKYDIMGGSLDRNLAYNYAAKGIKKILDENPSIEVVIDIHRDGAAKRVTKINGEDTAQIMLFNGLSRNTKGEIDYLKNPNLQDNLAFSFQIQLKGRELFPGLMYKNYLHAYRYNMQVRKKSMLAEVGTNKNTVSEAKNAMKYLAVILHEVLGGDTAE